MSQNGATKKKSRLSGFFIKSGSPGWTRTSDIRINSPVFYQLNYWGIAFLIRR